MSIVHWIGSMRFKKEISICAVQLNDYSYCFALDWGAKETIRQWQVGQSQRQKIAYYNLLFCIQLRIKSTVSNGHHHLTFQAVQV